MRGAWFGTADATGDPGAAARVRAADALALRLGGGRARGGDPPEAVRARRGAVLRRSCCSRAHCRGRRSSGRAARSRRCSLAGFLPFLIADAGALWSDTIGYGTGTYRILGYGLSALLLNAGVIDDRYGAYPFALLALLVWLPVTAWLVWVVRRSGRDWEAAAGFAVSIFVLLFIARVFQTSYLSGR